MTDEINQSADGRSLYLVIILVSFWTLFFPTDRRGCGGGVWYTEPSPRTFSITYISFCYFY